MGVGGFSYGAKEFQQWAECRCGLVFEIQGMLNMREWLITLQMCQGGLEKSYESGGTPFWTMEIEVWLFPMTSGLPILWVGEDLLRPFLELLSCWIWLQRMDIRQHCFSRSKTYSEIATFFIHICCDHNDMMVYVSAKELPDDSFVIDNVTIPLPFLHEPHRNAYLHVAIDQSSNTEADSEYASINLESPPVRTHISTTPHLNNHLASKPITTKYFDIFDDKIDLWSLFSCEE